MFDYVGGKIKGFAVVVCWIGIICSCIVGIMFIINGVNANKNYYGGGSGAALIVEGLVIIIVGSVSSWLGSLMTYGFGELVENSYNTSQRLQEIEDKIKKTPQASSSNESSHKSDLFRASSSPTIQSSSKNSEADEIYKALSECETVEDMLSFVKGGYPSYRSLISALKKCASEEQSYGRSYKKQALSEAKTILRV